jgi:hypothetical protein
MCTAAALYTQFTAFNTPPSHWIGFQVIQGLGVGMAQQMPSLIVQLAVHDKPELMPAAVSLNLFFQYLGATVTQVIGGIVFRSILGKSLDDHGLNASQIALLSAAGTGHIREITKANFPKMLRPVLESYNQAITSTFVSGHSLGDGAENLTDRWTSVVCCSWHDHRGILFCFRG